MIGKHEPATESYEKLFRSLFLDTADCILLAYSDLLIVEANDRTREIYEMRQEQLLGTDCRNLVLADDRPVLDQAFALLEDDQSWVGELKGIRGGGDIFPIDITVKRVLFEGRPIFCIVIRDLTEYTTLRERLRQEKSNRREMYITLRNLMKAFEKEKKGLEDGISHKIETLILPALEKVRKERAADVRNSYLNIIEQQLIGMTRGFARELDGRFLKLTRMEMRICKYIQSGYSSKEIAEKLALSFETIQVHRRSIRRKLDLRGRKVNLYGFLSTKSFLKD